MRAEPCPVASADDPRLGDYVGLTDVALRTRTEPAAGLYIAESSTVLGRALAAGHRPRSVLCAPRWLDDVVALLASSGLTAAAGEVVPVYVADEPVLESITGFHVHRGALAAMHRPALLPVADVVADARRVVVLEDLVDHTNVGAAFRACAGLGVDAVLVTPSCADPLYRRSVRVSMGAVFGVPWTRLPSWPDPPVEHCPTTGSVSRLRGPGPRSRDTNPARAEQVDAGAEPSGGVQQLRDLGFTVVALALDDDATTLDALAAALPERLALVFGTEGDGLRRRTVAACDRVVRIPMSGGIDSLNVASAVAVAAWATRPG
ncbi:MAG: RNA methyltransferase [Micrococcales bacterium]|nr:RNA methyltransferase [Micrococcales bacterium]